MDLSILDKQIFERFIRPTVNKKPQYVGVEFELPLVNLKSAPVDFSVVHALVDAFLEHFGFVPVAWDDEGAVCSAQSEENGDDLSFDCSYNTLELSFGRVRDLNRIEERFRSYYRFIRSFLRSHGHSITGMGINPRYLYNHREPVPNGCYRMLLNHLNSYERYTDRMVFHDLPFFDMMACSSQTHIDVNRDELLRVLDLYNRLEPLKALLFANSPYGGEYLCARDYSGIHFNYSFSEDLLRRSARLEDAETPEAYRLWKDRFYLDLAEQVLAHSWVVVALLGASPLTDSSFFESGRTGQTVFTGSASLRSGPLGYWNHFSPLLSCESMEEYVESIQKYIDSGMIAQASELYYPVRLKSSGAYSLDALQEQGADHIELRMIDLNPFAQDEIALEDLRFLQLLLLWLASRPRKGLDSSEQVFALQNHKNAAAYD